MEELRIVREELMESVSGLTSEQINKHINEETWSIAQILYHLYLTERLVARLIRKVESFPDDLVELRPIEYLLNRSVKINSPKEIEPSIVNLNKDEIIIQLETSRATLLQALNDLDDLCILDRKAVPHPILGNMRLSQWVDLIHYHEQRHIAQIKEIIGSF